MANYPEITIIGNLAGDPELRWTASGHAVANFTVAQTPRTKNQQGEFVDDETLWVRCSVWREMAENVAETLSKGTRVVVTGKLKARSFETNEGQQRTNWELDVDEVGPSLRWATAQVNRKQPGGQSSPVPPTAGGGWGAAPDTVWGGGQQQGQGNTSAPF